MSSTPSPAATVAESWLNEAMRRIVLEAWLFGRTFAAFALRPRRSARSWQDGQQRFMNPLGFAASAAGVYWAAVGITSALWPVPGTEATDTVADQLTSAVAPYVQYGLLGIAMHLGLKGLGSKRRLLGSAGVAFFAGGSIGTAGSLVLRSIVRWFGHERGTTAFEIQSGDMLPTALMIAGVLWYSLLCLMIARGMMGLHRAPGWKAIMAAAFAMVVTALLFGSVLPDGSYGWHPYIHLGANSSSGLTFSFGFRG